MVASEAGHAEIVQLLLEAGAEQDSQAQVRTTHLWQFWQIHDYLLVLLCRMVGRRLCWRLGWGTKMSRGC
jgi:ankyrin repeat protein